MSGNPAYFPWGFTYDVPAQIENGWHISRTPCHRRLVRVDEEAAVAGASVVARCPTCSRLWEVSFAGVGRGIATWRA